MGESFTVTTANGYISMDKSTQALRVVADGHLWTADARVPPCVATANGEIPFTAAERVAYSEWKTGVGAGIRCAYSQIPGFGGFAFDIIVWCETATGHVIFEFIPISEAVNAQILHVRFPAPFVLEGASSYSALTCLQGCILPNDWGMDFPELKFNGQMCSQSAYMPWWGQVREDSGYIAIVEQPWDAKYTVNHAAGGPTSIFACHMPSLGAMGYRRTLRFAFLGPCDHNSLCAVYREYASEHGLLTTLKEKAARAPHLEKLVGSAVVHLGVKRHVSPTSRYYYRDDPEKNDGLTTFSKRGEQMRAVAEMGVKKAYLHLDGWGQPGYDNQHPDYTPACAEAGGWAGMKDLSDTCAELGFLFGIHDQYRDYYLDAPTYDPEMAVRLADGTLYGHAIWAGGEQNYLCSSQAPLYVKRNFEEIMKNGVRLDATYLDVFTCNEPDECSNPLHIVTRKESLEYRKQCFDYLLSRGILPSSEEIVDWAMQSLVFCHWAPYGAAAAGIPVPLLNLVYHDCVIIPWMLGRGEWGTPDGELGFLHALLNGGIGYLDPELPAAELETNLEHLKIVSDLHERVGMLPMAKHEFLSPDRRKQRTVFTNPDGSVAASVTVDFNAETYEIEVGR